jgi:SRSO17 transposase
LFSPVADANRWERAFERWIEPFCAAFRHKAQRRWAPVYLRGQLSPGDRKSVEPMAARVAAGDKEQLHHFVATAKWDTAPLEEVLVEKADVLVGGPDAHLIIDDTAIPKKGDQSVGVAHQYCGVLGKSANCQSLVSVTLARDEVPVPIALRLYLPESWANDAARRKKTGVPEDIVFRTKWQIALAEIDRVHAAGVRFGDVLADAGYGNTIEFRAALTERGFLWALGVNCDQLVYSRDVRVQPRARPALGRPPVRGMPSELPQKADDLIDALGTRVFRKITWRRGTRGDLSARFAIVRVRPADGPRNADKQRLPGDELWLVCELRTSGERKYYLTNHPADASAKQVVGAIKARWSCEQAHQQLKEELGLDHFEGRSWHGLHHHALLTMIAHGFLQHLRVRENKE